MKVEFLSWRKNPANIVIIVVTLFLVAWFRISLLDDKGGWLLLLRYISELYCYCIGLLASGLFSYDFDRETYKLKHLLNREQKYVTGRFLVTFCVVLFLALWGTGAIAGGVAVGRLPYVFLGLTAVMSVYASVSFGVAVLTRNQVVTMLIVLCFLYASAYVPELNPREFCQSYLMLKLNGIADDGSGAKLFGLSAALQVAMAVYLWLNPRNRRERAMSGKHI